MLAMRKITAITVVGAVVLVSVWIVGSKVAQSRRSSTYQVAIARFQHELPIGTPKEHGPPLFQPPSRP
jgi:hypothetical protein